MNLYHLAIAWNWEYDEDFLVAIEQECSNRGFSTLRISPENLPEVYQDVKSGEMQFFALLDRASDSDDLFVTFVNDLVSKTTTRVFNPFQYAERARDKTTMHLELMSNGVYVPHSLILPPFTQQPFIQPGEKELASLGIPFVVKPANNSGGGAGVHINARTAGDIFFARQEFQGDKYLIQEMVTPAVLDEKRAWFRVLYAFGEVIPCWWDDLTHIYQELIPEEEIKWGLTPLRTYAHTIQKVCKLDFFSTEIAMTHDGRFIAVDYVNEVCDMRPQSKCVDGVPESISSRIVTLLVNEVELEVHKSQLHD